MQSAESFNIKTSSGSDFSFNSFISHINSNFKQGSSSNQSFDDIEKSWKEKVAALEKVNEVLRREINELQHEAQSSAEILNQAKNKLQACKVNEMKVEKAMNVKISDLTKELERLKTVESKLEEIVKEKDNMFAEQSKLKTSSMAENKEFKLKISELQNEIVDLKQSCNMKECERIASYNATRERLVATQENLNTLQIKFHEQKKANEQISNQKSEFESKLSEKVKELEQSKKETSSLKGNITKIKNKNKESEEIIERIRDKINSQGFV